MTKVQWTPNDYMRMAMRMKEECKKFPDVETVGCVIVSAHNMLLATACARADGKTGFAEPIALSSVDNPHLLRGASLFTTLEPCTQATQGSSESCAEIVAKFGLAAVYFAKEQQNEENRGSALLRKRGIEVFHMPKLDTQTAEVKREFSRPILVL